MIVLGLLTKASATQYTCIVSANPTSIAGQLSAETNFGAASSMAKVSAIFTNSQTKKPINAELGPRDANRPVRPRAKTPAGMTTASEPYPADHPASRCPVTAQATTAVKAPQASCNAITLHGDTDGFFSRNAWACCALRGLNSTSGSSKSSSGAILVVLTPAPALRRFSAKPLIIGKASQHSGESPASATAWRRRLKMTGR